MTQSVSAFRELRLAAGLTRPRIANSLQVPLSRVNDWNQRGYRPKWRHMPALSHLFGISTAEAIRRIWGETVGDLCPCGCGGRVLDDDG